MFWTIASWITGVLGVGVVLYALFWDRPGWRGRADRRCKKCWYDLKESGKLPITCPECGRISENERSVTRTRRHKRAAMLGVLLMLGAPVVGLTPAYRQGKLFARMPSWMLIEIVPFFPTIQDDNQLFIKGNSPGVELITRLAIGADRISNPELVDIFHRVAEGNFYSKPGSREWQKSTAGWVRGQWSRFRNDAEEWQYPDGTPADQQLIDAIRAVQDVLPEWYPETRKHWPAGTNIMIQSGRGRTHWNTNSDERIYEEVEWSIRGTNESKTNPYGTYLSIPNPYPAGQEIVVDLTYRMYKTKGIGINEPITDETKGEVIKQQNFALRTRVVSGIDEVIEEVHSEFIDDLLIERLIPETPYDALSDAVLRGQAFKVTGLNGIGMGLRITLYDDNDRIIEYSPHWMLRNGNLSTMSLGKDELVPLDEVDARVQDALAKKTLRVRIVSDHTLLLPDFEVKRAWSGEIDMLYDDAVQAAYAETPAPDTED